MEVESSEVDGFMWHFKYPLAGGATYEYVEKDEDGNVTLRETRDYISIATTRPETMLGDGAVAVAIIAGEQCVAFAFRQHQALLTEAGKELTESEAVVAVLVHPLKNPLQSHDAAHAAS